MHWKKYAILLPPFVMIFLIMAFNLPDNQKLYAVLAIILFWIVYYSWIFIEKKKKDEIDKPSFKVTNK